MCGRFTLTVDLPGLMERFGCRVPDAPYTPSYNIAPGQGVWTVIADDQGQKRAGCWRWGLVPSWARDPRRGQRLINARVETVAEKPSFRQALRQRRCLILADGFYEWRQEGTGKSPVYIRLRTRQPFAMAGLWERWQDPAGTVLHTCTILTTQANTLLQPIHARMPVILSPDAEAPWLDRRLTSPGMLLPLLGPYAAAEMEAYAVSSLVNSPCHNSAACMAPLSPPGAL